MNIERETCGVINFLGYEVTNICFKKNRNYSGESVHIDTDLTAAVTTDQERESMDVELTLKLFSDAEEKGYPFSLDVSVLGKFKLENKQYADIKLFQSNAIAILFPYVRALVTTYTANANVAPLILPTINTNQFVEKNSEY